MPTAKDTGDLCEVTATLHQLVWTLAYAHDIEAETALQVRQAARILSAAADDLLLHALASPSEEHPERPDTGPLMDLPDLVAALAALPHLGPADRARHARGLAEVTKAVLGDVCARAMMQTGLSVTDLATELGMPPSAVRTALARLRSHD